MKRIFLLLLIGICCNNGFGQEACENSVFYQRSLNKLTNFTNSRHVIRFDYKMSESISESLFNNWQYSEAEKLIIKEALLNSSYAPCQKILKITSKLNLRPLSDKNTFMSWNYSKPIFVSDDKVYLFYEVFVKRENHSGVGGGSNRLEVYEKKDGVWKITNKKVLEYY